VCGGKTCHRGTSAVDSAWLHVPADLLVGKEPRFLLGAHNWSGLKNEDSLLVLPGFEQD